MHIYWFLLGLLAVWRVSHLLALEDGPWQMVVRIRRAAGNGFWGGLLDCFNCLSLWASVPFALGIGAGSGERVCLWLALSGGAITLQQLTSPVPPMPVFHEHGDPDHVMLRQSENTDPTEPPGSIGN
jgi:hypothetical protein